jgi:uncharacterized membrane protein
VVDVVLVVVGGGGLVVVVVDVEVVVVRMTCRGTSWLREGTPAIATPKPAATTIMST